MATLATPRRARAAILGAALIAVGCGHEARRDESAAPTTPSASAASKESSMHDVTLTLAPQGDTWAPSITITNTGAAPLDVPYAAPFLAFTIEARDARGQALSVLVPAVDVPSQRQKLSIAPGASAAIPTPIRLRFGDANQDGQRFLWTIKAPPQPVTLTATLEVSGLGERSATATLTP